MAATIKITIRDGRIGRDPAQATPGGPGAILAVIERSEPLDMGDKIRLADGTEVMVIGVDDEIGSSSWEQTVHVGDVWS